MGTDLPREIARFFDREAYELDDDSEESDFEDASVQAFIDNSTSFSSSRQPLTVTHTSPEAQDDLEDVARAIKERSRKRARLSPATYDDAEPTHAALCSFPMKTRFPHEAGIDDSRYRLYMIRTPVFKEKGTAEVLRQSLPDSCLVFTVTCLSGRMYVWAPDERTVAKSYRERGIENPPRLTFVPPADVESVFRLSKGGDFSQYEVGNWVTVRRGTYRGDYAIIREVLRGDSLKIAVVPRIRIRGSDQSGRSPPLLALPEDLKRNFPGDEIIQQTSNSFIFRGAQYVDGLRILTVPSVHYVRPASPSLADVFAFSIASLGDLEHVEFYLRRGDIVVAIGGPFQRVAGEVAYVDDRFVILGQACWLDKELQSWDSKSDCDINKLVHRSEVQDSISKGKDVLKNISVSRADIRRLFHTGDTVLVQAGPLTGSLGFVVLVMGNQELLLLVDETEDLVTVRSTYVEITSSFADGYEFRHDRTAGISRGSLVERKGVVGVVLHVDADYVKLQLVGGNVNERLSVHKNEVKLIELSDTVGQETQRALDILKRIGGFGRESRSLFIGAYVYIHGNVGFAKHKKGRYGYVRSVDSFKRTARVAYDSREDTFELRSLISVDRVMSLDPAHPLSRNHRLLCEELFEKLRKAPTVRRTPTPPPEQLPTEDSWTSQETADCVGAQFLEPVTDFTGPGMWVFSDTIQSLLSSYKIFIKDGVSSRKGALVASSPFGDHQLCRTCHDRCRVDITVDGGHRTVANHLREVNLLSPQPPWKKGDLVVQLRSQVPSQVGKILSVVGIPLYFSGVKKIAVCEPGDMRSRRELDEHLFTKVEKL